MLALCVKIGANDMPTILMIRGWRVFFYANEGNEPIHVHCRKGDRECKYWLDLENYDIEEAHGCSVFLSLKFIWLYINNQRYSENLTFLIQRGFNS